MTSDTQVVADSFETTRNAKFESAVPTNSQPSGVESLGTVQATRTIRTMKLEGTVTVIVTPQAPPPQSGSTSS